MRPAGAVGDVIDMGGKVVARVGLGDKSTQFDIFPHHFLSANGLAREALTLVSHTVVCHFCRIGDKLEYGILHIVVDTLQYLRHESGTELLTLEIDVSVGSTREIDTLEGTSLQAMRF